MRRQITPETLRELMAELARTAPRARSSRIYLVGGGTAVLAGWRSATIDADLFSEQTDVFRDVQGIKERLHLNIEFVRPEHFVPALAGSSDRHRFIERVGTIDFYTVLRSPSVRDRRRRSCTTVHALRGLCRVDCVVRGEGSTGRVSASSCGRFTARGAGTRTRVDSRAGSVAGCPRGFARWGRLQQLVEERVP